MRSRQHTPIVHHVRLSPYAGIDRNFRYGILGSPHFTSEYTLALSNVSHLTMLTFHKQINKHVHGISLNDTAYKT